MLKENNSKSNVLKIYLDDIHSIKTIEFLKYVNTVIFHKDTRKRFGIWRYKNNIGTRFKQKPL